MLPIGFAHGEKSFRGLEIFFLIGQRKTVVGTHVLADVATVNPIVETSVSGVEIAFIFNREVGNAFPRIK